MKVKAYGRMLEFTDPSWEMKGRWQGTLSPEPETVAWIESMAPGEVFYDIGANVGRFSVLAACRGLKVFAFEPEAQRYAELCRALWGNKLDVVAYCVAVAGGLQFGRLVPGRSTHTFGYGSGQGAIALSLDEIVDEVGCYPDHVKIDVDGNEPSIIDGARRVMERAKSVLIEIDPGAERHGELVGLMRAAGFGFDQAQVDACTVRDGSKFTGMANYIFRKVA
jgi:FkbM family methyltransferase